MLPQPTSVLICKSVCVLGEGCVNTLGADRDDVMYLYILLHQPHWVIRWGCMLKFFLRGSPCALPLSILCREGGEGEKGPTHNMDAAGWYKSLRDHL